MKFRLIILVIAAIAIISNLVKCTQDHLSGRAAWEDCRNQASREWDRKYSEAAWREKGALSRLDRAKFYDEMCGKRP